MFFLKAEYDVWTTPVSSGDQIVFPQNKMKVQQNYNL